MSFSTILIDLDDTLYPSTSGLWALMRNRIEIFVCYKLGLSWAEARRVRQDLFQRYGTTMRGLQAAYQVDEEEYLLFVHNVPLWNFIHPDARLKAILACYPQRKIIFTNADQRHARRVLHAMDLEGCVEQVIDIRAMAPYCKPMAGGFRVMLEKISEPPEACILVDDSPPNLHTAMSLGMGAVWVGTGAPPPGIRLCIPRLVDLPTVLRPSEGGYLPVERGLRGQEASVQ